MEAFLQLFLNHLWALSGKSHLVVNLGGNCFVASSNLLPLQWPNSQSHLAQIYFKDFLCLFGFFVSLSVGDNYLLEHNIFDSRRHHFHKNNNTAWSLSQWVWFFRGDFDWMSKVLSGGGAAETFS